MKTAKTKDDAYSVEDKKQGEPHGWIQWKGTDVCMDIHCQCGEMFHIDGYFAYHVKCPHCKAVYFCNGHIELIKLEIEPESCVIGAQP